NGYFRLFGDRMDRWPHAACSDSIGRMIKRIALLVMFFVCPLTPPRGATAQSSTTQNVDNFFRTFTNEWVRGNPNLAVSSRYFSGEAQDRLDRQLTPDTDVYHRARIQLAKRGLTELRKFDRARMPDAQRLSADLMEWQLD